MQTQMASDSLLINFIRFVSFLVIFIQVYKFTSIIIIIILQLSFMYIFKDSLSYEKYIIIAVLIKILLHHQRFVLYIFEFLNSSSFV